MFTVMYKKRVISYTRIKANCVTNMTPPKRIVSRCFGQTMALEVYGDG